MRLYIIVLISLLFLFSCRDDNQRKHIANSESKQDTLGAPKKTVLAALPDSLHPKTKALDTMPKPRIVTVPTTSGSSYSITSAEGEVLKINLEPPVYKLLPVLQEELPMKIQLRTQLPYIH